jgi:response regulator RpfG family c-di-GMP phosphodiesterase
VETNTESTVVLVDDEEMVLTSLNAYLTLETDYNVESFTDVDEALVFVKEQPVDVIISDYLMPRMNGIQFLGKAKELQPETSRILLTGHADKQSAIEAINEVGLFQYIEKPWDNAALMLVIRNGSERTNLLRSLRVKIQQLDEAHSNLKTTQSELIRAFL